MLLRRRRHPRVWWAQVVAVVYPPAAAILILAISDLLNARAFLEMPYAAWLFWIGFTCLAICTYSVEGFDRWLGLQRPGKRHPVRTAGG